MQTSGFEVGTSTPRVFARPRMESEPIALNYSREFESIRGSKMRFANDLMPNRMIANLREARDQFRQKRRSRGIF